MGACPLPVPASGGGGALPPEQVPKDWASVGCGWALPIALRFPWAGGGRADRQGPGRWWGCRGPDQVEVKAAWSRSCRAERRGVWSHLQGGCMPRRQAAWAAPTCPPAAVGAVVRALRGGAPACQPPLKAHRSASCRSSKHRASGAQMSQQLRPGGPGPAPLGCPDPRLSPQC